MNHFFTLSEVAKMLRVNREAVRRAAQCKKLRGTKPGKEWLFAPADILAYIESGYNRPEETDNE